MRIRTSSSLSVRPYLFCLANGIKVDFVQAHYLNGKWLVPLFVIEDELTLLSQNQNLAEQIGEIVYDTSASHWRLVLNI